MADRHGRSLGEPPSSPRPSQTPMPARDSGLTPCVACHAYHGSVNVEIACLSAAIAKLRGEAQRKDAIIRKLQDDLEIIRGMPWIHPKGPGNDGSAR